MRKAFMGVMFVFASAVSMSVQAKVSQGFEAGLFSKKEGQGVTQQIVNKRDVTSSWMEESQETSTRADFTKESETMAALFYTTRGLSRDIMDDEELLLSTIKVDDSQWGLVNRQGVTQPQINARDIGIE